LRHRFHSRGGAVLARVAVQFLARSNRRTGYMTCGPGPPCWTHRSRKGAPPWCGFMPPAWRSALSLAGLGESGEALVTAGQLRAPRAAVWLLPPCRRWRNATSRKLVPFSHLLASRIFIRQPGCIPSPVVTQDGDHQFDGGEKQAGLRPLPHPQLQGSSSSWLGRRPN
jgi:hypothetical protein